MQKKSHQFWRVREELPEKLHLSETLRLSGLSSNKGDYMSVSGGGSCPGKVLVQVHEARKS